MEMHRRNAIIVGLLFLLATAAGVLSLPLTGALEEADYLSRLAGVEGGFLAGILLIFIMAFACAGIAIWLYPVLRPHAPGAALGAAGFRLIEAVFHCLSAVIMLATLSLSRQYLAAGAQAGEWFGELGALLQSTRHWSGSVSGTLAWCLGALLYYRVFYRARLLPRWLSGWGLIGVPLTVAGVVLVLFGITPSMSTLHVLLNMPLALQELVLALWLVVRGFEPAAIAGRTAAA
jgi:hypothetical protein